MSLVWWTTYWVLALMVLVMYATVILYRLPRHASATADTLAALGGVALVLWAGGLMTARRGIHRRTIRTWPIALSLILAGAVATLTLGLSSLGGAGALPLACIVATVALSLSGRWWGVTAAACLPTVHLVLGHWVNGVQPGPRETMSIAWMSFFMIVGIPTSLWVWDVMVELDRTRRTAAELAVANERLRFAADLHDVQGHHLQIISLKTDLASRLLAKDNPHDAASHISDAHDAAQTALRETRALVQGYR